MTNLCPSKLDRSRRGKAARNAGYRAELAVRDTLRAAGLSADRVPLSGQNGNVLFSGDIHVEGPTGVRKIEVKRRKNGQGFATIDRWMMGADWLVLSVPYKEPLAVLPLKELAKLVALAAGTTKENADD